LYTSLQRGARLLHIACAKNAETICNFQLFAQIKIALKKNSAGKKPTNHKNGSDYVALAHSHAWPAANDRV
jgi:hypothetical protein